jgi:hypothetical protein
MIKNFSILLKIITKRQRLGSKFKDEKSLKFLTISRLAFKSKLSTILHSLQEFNFRKGRARSTMKGN